MKRSITWLALIGIVWSSACGSPPPDNQGAIETAVAGTQATLTANAPQATEAMEEPEQTTGSISGSLTYPSEFLPPMLVVAFDANSEAWYTTTTEEGSGSYQIDGVPPGSYHVVAYPNLEGLSDFGGGYTPAVACGLSVDCTDHTLLTVEVVAGEVTAGIDPHDWYAPKGTYPPRPGE